MRMTRFWLIGLGLNPPESIPQGFTTALGMADEVWLEAYTSMHPLLNQLAGALRELIPTRLVTRRDVEESLLAELEEKRIILAVLGHPLAATTHVSLLAEARRKGVPARVLGAESIFTSIAMTGISLYKLGRTVSLPYPRRQWQPDSWKKSLMENMRMGVHTLILLDILTPPDTPSSLADGFTPEASGDAWLMSLPDAIRLLTGVLPEDAFLISCTRLGQPDSISLHGRLEDYQQASSLPQGGPHCLIHAQPDEIEREHIRMLTTPVREWQD